MVFSFSIFQFLWQILMRSRFCFIFLFFLFQGVFAQSDSLSPFRMPGLSGVKGKGSSVGNNTINISLGHFIRGGTVITYERLLGEKGLALYGGLGFSVRDVIGQYSINHSGPIVKDMMADIQELGGGLMVDVGAKYYFEKLLGNTFIGAGVTSITNNMIVNYGFDYLQNDVVTNRNYKLNYRNNEVKFMIGMASDPQNKFFNEFSIGPKIRFLNYDYVDATDNPDRNSDYDYIVTNGSKQEVRFRIFFGWKMGVRF